MQQALATYGKLAARVPSSPVPLVAMADLMMSSKDTAGAEQNLRKALAIKPDSLEAQQRLVAVLLNDKRGDAAVAMSKDVQRQRKDSPLATFSKQRACSPSAKARGGQALRGSLQA
jgi:predicted Zn-dependent protease